MGLNRVTGRPHKFTDLNDLQARIDDYFAECDAKGRPYTITGLALWLDTTRETLCDYECNPSFSDAIKRAKEIVANYAVEQVLIARNPAGAIFIAKNHGMSDNIKIDQTVHSDHHIAFIDPRLTDNDS